MIIYEFGLQPVRVPRDSAVCFVIGLNGWIIALKLFAQWISVLLRYFVPDARSSKGGRRNIKPNPFRNNNCSETSIRNYITKRFEFLPAVIFYWFCRFSAIINIAKLFETKSFLSDSSSIRLDFLLFFRSGQSYTKGNGRNAVASLAKRRFSMRDERKRRHLVFARSDLW